MHGMSIRAKRADHPATFCLISSVAVRIHHESLIKMATEARCALDTLQGRILISVLSRNALVSRELAFSSPQDCSSKMLARRTALCGIIKRGIVRALDEHLVGAVLRLE